MASGGRRYDFTTEDHFTQGENRTVRFPVEDSAGDPVASFTGWTFVWYLYNKLSETSEEALITKATSDGITTPAVPPNVDVTLVPADTSALRAKTYWYELWRDDSGDAVRLAWGQFPIID